MNKESSIKNLVYAYIGQFFGVIINFFSRIVFIKILGNEYLGINSLFINIITFLSFTELGIGSAMTFSLYEPLEKNNKVKIKALMKLYKKYYRLIGSIVLILGLSITPFLKYIIKDMPDIENLRYYYILFVLNSSISYFYTYKRTLIICDRKRYIATFYRYLFYFLLNFSQIFILLFFKSYFLFLILQIIFTLLENISISRKAEKLYPYLKEKNVENLDKESKKILNRDIKATFFGRLGGTIINSTDSIVISKYLGVIEVGVYSNYSLIISAITTIINQIFVSMTASIGNIGVTRNEKELKKIFDRVFFLNFIAYGLVSICLVNIINPFIQVWLGSEFTLEMNIVIIIIINFFMIGLRSTIVTFKDAMGLYWRDKYRPIITCSVNVIFSIILVQIFGLKGVVIGTIISNCFDLAIEPYFLYKFTLKSSTLNYYKKYLEYCLITACISIVMHFILKCILVKNLIFNLIIKSIFCLCIAIVFIILIYMRTEEFNYFFNIIIDLIKRLKKKIIK